MYQLLLDSANKLLVVGLAEDGKVIDQTIYEAWQRQSEMMVPEIENIMKRNNIAKEDFDAIVVGIGPGSYTGIRIALTIAKTMAYALNIPMYATSSLSLFKDEKEPTICVLNARSGRSYVGVYEGDKVLLEDQVLENDKVKEYIAEHPTYLVSGECEHLGIKPHQFDLTRELANAFNEKHLVKDIFRVNPVYLKDLYKWLTIVD